MPPAMNLLRLRTSSSSSFPAVAVALLLWATSAPAHSKSAPAEAPQSTDEALATGPGSRLQMLLEKTFLGFDVLRITIRVDKATQKQLAALVSGRSYSERLEQRIARIGSRLTNAVAQITFLRHISLRQFVGAVIESLELARDAKMITDSNFRATSRALPRWFAFLEQRGIRPGDQLIYRVRPSSLRTRFVAANGELLLDQTDQGVEPRLALLSGYFAPGSDFRTGLARSLFARRE